jgi:hypothetical protein
VKVGSVVEQPSRHDLEIVSPPGGPSGASDIVRIVLADQPVGADFLDQEGDARVLAELASHSGATTPFTIGLFGASGSGKSFFLEKFAAHVVKLSDDASGQANKTPFLSRIAVARVDVAASPQPIESTIAAEIYGALLQARADGTSYTGFAEEAAQATSDPHTSAREAGERLDALRRRLDDEHQTLHELEGRRAKLSEAVLYESSGSRIDAFARTNRARIEQRLKAFGFSAGEPIENYKDLVRNVAEYGPTTSSIRTVLRAVWSYTPQFRLLTSAVVFALLGLGLSLAANYRAQWIPWLWEWNDKSRETGVWLESHYDLFQYGSWAFYALALLCLATNIWRAFRFANPLVTGASLLKGDVARRQAELDVQHAYQSRRVESLVSEADRLGQRADEAERRARAASQQTANLFAGDDTAATAARKFLAAAAALMAGKSAQPQPKRLVVALDNFDALPANQAADTWVRAHACLAHPGFVSVAAIDRAHLVRGLAAFGNVPERLEKSVQIPFDVGAASNIGKMSQTLIANLIGEATTPPQPPPAPKSSSLDHPWSDADRVLLQALAPLAGASPRSAKRFANLVRLSRAQLAGAAEGPAHFASLAVALALDAGGTDEEIASFERALSQSDLGASPQISAHMPRLAAALEAARSHAGAALTAGDLRRGRDFAKRYGLRMTA